MSKQTKKKGVGVNKNFGPIQKLAVPDFQHISNTFEQMQNEILDKPQKNRKQMKSFTIRKLAQPQQSGTTQLSEGVNGKVMGAQGYNSVGGVGDSNQQQAVANQQNESLLTAEEREALKPKDVKVVNPWIHEQTHKEYLENVKGLPARHANVIKKHRDVIKEKTFLPEVDKGFDKDLATQEALKILDEEYKIFNLDSVPGTKVLTRYDTWDEDRTPEQWVDYCQARPGEPHGLSPVFHINEYMWKPVEVLDYDEKEKKFKVKVTATNQVKYVTRLSLLFFNEDPEQFKKRVNECKARQAIVEAELKFTNIVDSVPTDSVSELSKERRFNFLSKCVRESDKFDPEKVYNTFKHLIRVVEEEYIRQMKKCIIYKEMADPKNIDKFNKLKIPIRLNKRTLPYYGVVKVPIHNMKQSIDEIIKTHWSSDPNLVIMTKIFTKKCIDFQQNRFMQTNRAKLQLPQELKDLQKIQDSHSAAVAQNMLIQWREYLYGEIQDKLKQSHNFFESEAEVYEASVLRNIISRFEKILNTYLRQFVQTSIEDWQGFIKSFTVPNLAEGELWKLSETPFIVVHLSLKKKRDTKKDTKKGKKEESPKKQEEEEGDDMNRVEYAPSLTKCHDFMNDALVKLVGATNNINNLENDLMPFLNYTTQSNFPITMDFPWIKDAQDQIQAIFDHNITGPMELLNKYKAYENILNTDNKALIKELFDGEYEGGKKKAPKEVIRQKLKDLEIAYEEISNLSNDVVDFPLFRVMTKKMKEELCHQANKTKEKIMDALYTYIKNSVRKIGETYDDMQKNISRDPTNERELVETREFIKKSPAKDAELTLELNDVYNHQLILDDNHFMYTEQDIEHFWSMKRWPLIVSELLGEGNMTIAKKEEQFMINLDQEKERFFKSIETYKETFNKIKQFKNLNNVGEYSADSFKLRQDLDSAFQKVQQFNEREGLFNQNKSEYPELLDLNDQFKPFFELTTMAHEIEFSFKDWTQNQLMKQDSHQIDQSVKQWHSACFQLYKKLNEDFPETAETATELRVKIEDFMQYLPLIKCFTSEAIFDEEWNEIQEVVGEPLEQEEVKVQDIIDKNLNRFMEEIEEIHMKAEKKLSLQKNLRAMKDEMKRFELELFPHKAGTYVLKGYDNVNLILDDQIVKVQAMISSSYMKGKVRKEAKDWEKKLNDMSELIEEIQRVQRTWQYLEPIFASEDIMNTMKTEGTMFKAVDKLWRDTMEGINQDKGIIDLIDRENIKVSFEDANKNLDKIQKHLNQYLEQKRLVFARFFFLANDDLLQILAQTKEPRAVQPHMDKCFEGIQRVMFSEKDEVYGMISAEGEQVELLDKIDVNAGDRKGNVEKWMLDIEYQMRKSLKQITKDSLHDYEVSPRTEWVKKWPGQIVLSVDCTHWTKGVEKALLDDSEDAIEKYRDLLQQQINDVVILVRGDLEPMTRVTLKAMVVIDVHGRDVVDLLIKEQVKSIDEFNWVSQLRYYWETGDELRVKMVTAILDYGYEYLGNSPRLVITSLTDRCYRTLLGAKFLNYGGAPEGPAGTGKTESVKDLAKALAVQCVVFNCSDGLDYLAMAKFFKGLASSGAWCCFDEFNRIDLEVLSVIAQQILSIQMAIKNKKLKKFIFEDTELHLNRGCAVNITMNPGYAGRSELPDNLKALFRPCAMMVPDYALIAEIELYSFGFTDAKKLSVKLVASLRLSSEQLSSQDHYDFGMRAVKAILSACGNLRRIISDWPEDLIGLRALNDVNLPKFTSNDIPLFNGITSDLFPGSVLPKPDYSQLMDGMELACKQKNLQPKAEFLMKCIQLYETITVRHGLMVVGGAYSGKSKVIDVLKFAMSNIKDNPQFANVLTYFINPKSILQNQLYGNFDEDTGEWTDGVLAINIRNCAESETPDKKWIIFDGPVDAVWIENMNTVLDDNKKLCLNSGQIIKLKPTMTIMFEVEDLSQASPATVSRCGMVLLEPQQLGHNVLITSYFNDLSLYVDKEITDGLNKSAHFIANVAVEFSSHVKYPVGLGPNFLVNQMLQTFDTYVKQFKNHQFQVTNALKQSTNKKQLKQMNEQEIDEEVKRLQKMGLIPEDLDEDQMKTQITDLKQLSEKPEFQLPGNAQEMMENALVFAAIWGIGGSVDEHTREAWNAMFNELIMGEDVKEKYKLIDLPDEWEAMTIPCKLPDQKSLFDSYYNSEQLNWVKWERTVSAYQINKDSSFVQLIIPTTDSIRVNKLIKQLVMSQKHILVCGLTGTGKSICVASELENSFNNEDYNYISMGFSAQTSANQTQKIIDGKMEKRRKGVYGPPSSKKGVIFVDDLNMPQKETYGAQPPIELLRQWMDYNGWYDLDTPEKDFRQIIGVNYITAMGPPGGGRNSITMRYVRHFTTVYVEPYSDDSLKNIFAVVMDWFFLKNTKPAFKKELESMKDSLTNNTIYIYKEIQKNFRPTPAKSHYTYNLRDVSKVFQGVSKASPKSINCDDDFIKLWAHECMRVFQDRLISDEDRAKFDELMNSIVKEKFKKDMDKICTVRPLLFGSFVQLCYPDGDKSKKPFQDVYCEFNDPEKVKSVTESQLVDYNNFHHSKKMNLVLFDAAIEHVAKIHRVITNQYGHALLVGVGGSGRKSLTELAVFIANYETFGIELTKSYDFAAWRDDMKQKLFMGCGVDQKQTIFLFSDTQIIMESFVEDINNILNNGEIPNLYIAQEDQFNIIEGMREVNKHLPQYKNINEAEIMLDFMEKAKENLHLVLAMSPIGEDFKRRLRMFPSLINCCAIDWFLPWPNEALSSVAKYFLQEVELDQNEKDGIVKICVDMQQRVHKLTQKYLAELKRYYYVTPTSYLVLLKAFKQLLADKRKVIGSEIKKYDVGLKQLADASSQVDTLSQELQDLIPQLQKKAKETGAMMVEIETQKKFVAEKTKEAKAEEAVASAKKEEASTIQKDCELQLAKVEPIAHAAIKAVDQLNKKDITELKSFKTVGEPVACVAEGMCIMFNVPPVRENGSKPGEKINNWWKAAQEKVLTIELLKKCKTYDKDNVDPEIIEKLRPLIASPNFQDDVLKKASAAAHGLSKWVRAMVQYDDAMKIVKPKQEQLKGAKEESAAAEKIYQEAMEKLRVVEEQMKKLMDQFEAAKNEEERLKAKKDDCEKKYKRAGSLIEKLKGEKETWEISLEKRREDKDNLTGDIIISSGIIAYLGVFSADYREQCVTQWISMVNSLHIKSNDVITLQQVLGNPVKIRQWQIDKLPTDGFSTDNAIIMENSDRWPLMIDPQMQANTWVKRMEAQNDLKVIKPTMDARNLSRTLEISVQHGVPIILEDAFETFDPLLEPLLAKNLEKKGSQLYIRLGEQIIPYDKKFRFYITTKISRPHYSPEVCVNVTMLNFQTTEEGLEDQMLQIVVKFEDQQKYEKMESTIIQQAEDKRKEAELQQRILDQISNDTIPILENDELVEVLDDAKEQYKQFEHHHKEMESSMKHINTIKEQFLQVAVRVSRLFFVIAELQNVNPMYQYSLDFYRRIYMRALQASKKTKEGEENALKNKETRKQFYIKKFTKLLYKNVCRSLFEVDKLLFSFLMSLKIMQEQGVYDSHEARFLMTGGNAVDSGDRPNPSGENGWLSNKQWAQICEMADNLPAFKGFDVDFTKHVDTWHKISESLKPQSLKQAWPEKWNELSMFRRLVVIRILRPDKVVQTIQKLIKKDKELGKNFITPPPFNLDKVFNDSTNKTPIIMVLSAGADPMTELQKLSDRKKIKFLQLSLGQGQGGKAVKAIKQAQEDQLWVVLQNCHLAPSFMPTLDALIEEIEEDTTSNFRIWLTSMPTDKFPVSILQNGVKCTNEPPKGLRNNIMGSYLGLDEDTFESCKNSSAYKKLMFGLCFFNALCLERRKFGPLGWNIQYEFSASDLKISQSQLLVFLNFYEEIPWEALKYMVSEANYGGRVTDPQDRRCINLILTDFYNKDMLKEGHKLVESGIYYVPPDGQLSSYPEFIKETFPINDVTEIFGLHDNANITSAINQTTMMLDTALSLLPREVGGEGMSEDQVIQEAATNIINKLPLPFDTEDAARKHPIKYEESLNTVLQQELLRFNRLIQIVRTSLINLGKAIKGEVVMSIELESVAQSLKDNKVPAMWQKRSFASMKPLASYIIDFIKRLEFMQDWIDNGCPANVWFSGLFFQQSFITGCKQNYARKYVIAIDQIEFDFQVISDPMSYDTNIHPDDGAYIYGMYLEGCRWDADKGKEFLAESHPKVLYTQMPTMWLIPKKRDDIDFGHSYECPLYKTSRRAGTLSTTGHSTNFVLMIWLPMQKRHNTKHWVKRGVAMLTQLND